ncbi:MAG: BatD family protein, partial [Chthoniobacteraceae bacterium]
MLAALFGVVGSLFSQNVPPLPPGSLPPSSQAPDLPGARVRQLQIQPGSGPVIIGPGGSIMTPGAEDVELAASAGFEPPVGRVGRPTEYRVTITGSQRPLELPDPAAPPGLEVSSAGRSVGTQILNGRLVTSTVFRYSVVAGQPGRFVIPGIEVLAGAKRVRVPDAVFTATEPQPGEAAYQSLRVELEMPKRDFFVGETIGARLLVAETPDESPQYIAHVGKTTGSAVFRPSLRTRREQFTLDGQQVTGLVMPVQITPILEGEAEIGCQVIVHVQKLDPAGRRSGFTAQNTMDAKPARIRVLALPRAGKLPGFTGAIGEFTIGQPKLSAGEVEVGE